MGWDRIGISGRTGRGRQDGTGGAVGSGTRQRSSSRSRRSTRDLCKPRSTRITPHGHTASHARHVTHDTDTEVGTRFPGWEPQASEIHDRSFVELWQ